MLPTPSEAELELAGARLGELLLSRGWKLATAESSTGGLIGHVITLVPGASRYYVGGVISYSNQAKEVELAVPHDLITQHGAVSPEVAQGMADGVRTRFGVELGVAVTGIAGPEGGSREKPVGTHYVAVSLRGHPDRVEHRVLGHDREGNKAAAAMIAIELAIDEVRAASPGE
ncbi:MAG TPA: CinA family protein [Candidatus Limnocylindria bacterium]|jgi:PncC family amidohydrolase|nr:CinA family protein [Candidatus Limnocylindria bacterium]